MADIQELNDIANKIRLYSLASTTKAGSGHPTSCFSIAEVMSVLFFHTLKQSKEFPKHPSSDRFILSKGHAAPVLYAAWTAAGLLTEEQNLSLRQNESDIEGHPTPRLNFVDVATGSLGQGLSCGCGMAYVGKYFDKASYRVYVVLGDGESAEGSNWEAMAFAAYYKLDNLVLIIDVNRLGQSEPTQLQHDTETYRKRADAFGFHTKVINGHSVEELIQIFDEAKTVKDKPTCVIAKTYKGHGSTKVSDKHGYHGKALKSDHNEIEAEISGKIQNTAAIKLGLTPFEDDAPKIELSPITLSSPPNYKIGDNAAVRKAYGVALAKMGDNSPLITTFDADTKNSTFAQDYKDKYPDRHVECFIAEQNMVGVAIGAACRNRRIAFVSTFACFLTRAFDQIRMGAISQTEVSILYRHFTVCVVIPDTLSGTVNPLYLSYYSMIP
ncbi:Transketolase-like protein 2 [Oopsacas minuta]|uniref:Transketolase-like protein 2 n=1 Tax=Oopsacas minuta TaxID=111878 RepID=A0AAV7KAB6_9METZ|nr:Transketolase-like protein 2 [Oopsacas minuta]